MKQIYFYFILFKRLGLPVDIIYLIVEDIIPYGNTLKNLIILTDSIKHKYSIKNIYHCENLDDPRYIYILKKYQTPQKGNNSKLLRHWIIFLFYILLTAKDYNKTKEQKIYGFLFGHSCFCARSRTSSLG